MLKRPGAPGARGEGPGPEVLAASALLAASGLGIQVALLRHFSFLYWYHSAFLVTGVGLLGLGAAGSALAAAGGAASRVRALRLSATSASGCALALAAYLLWGPALDLEPLALWSQPGQFLRLGALELWCLLAFLPLGLAQVSLLAGFQDRAPAVYGADLLGAAAGCLATLGLLSAMNPTAALLVWGGAAALAGVLLARGLPPPWRLAPAASLALAAGLLLSGWASHRPFLPAPSKGVRLFLDGTGGAALERTVFSPTIRLDVTAPIPTRFLFNGEMDSRAGDPAVPTRVILVDGAAPTFLYDIPDPRRAEYLDRAHSALVYRIRRGARVCVIGAGGGPDVLIALRGGARSVTAVEYNARMVRLARDTYGPFNRNLFGRPDVEAVVAEGRNYLARTRRRFGVIQLSTVLTRSAVSSGAYSAAESFLYTVEAGRAMLRALEPGGVISLSEWYLEPAETHRVVNCLAEALRSSGRGSPEGHVFALRAGDTLALLACERPFRADELDALSGWTAERGWEVLYDPRTPRGGVFDLLLRAPEAERLRAERMSPHLLVPPTDDRPFFFHTYKWRNLLAKPGEPGAGVPMPVGDALLLFGLLQMAVLSPALVAGPLLLRGAGMRGIPGRWLSLLFFACIGLGFMLVEMTAISTFTVFLGAPVLSLAVTLAALLASAGAGALFADRPVGGGPRAPVAAATAAALWGLASAVALRPILGAVMGWPLPARCALAVLWLLPGGFALGVPFASAIRGLRRDAPALVPWAWAVNGCASVLGAPAGVLLAMQVGYRATLLVAALAYALGLGAWVLAWRDIGAGAGAAPHSPIPAPRPGPLPGDTQSK